MTLTFYTIVSYHVFGFFCVCVSLHGLCAYVCVCMHTRMCAAMCELK